MILTLADRMLVDVRASGLAQLHRKTLPAFP